MFIGHAAVGFASKRWAPSASLGVLLAAPFLADLVWPLFLLFGWEQVRIDPGNTAVTPLDFISYPYTHSLLAAVLWAAVFALIYRAVSRYTTGAIVVGVGVLSHWVLDAVSHRPDMPLWPGGPKVGLGLWYSVPATVVVEIALLAIGLWLCRCRSRGVWAMVAVLLLAYIANLLGPPPPNVQALAGGALALWAFPLWGWWISRSEARSPGSRESHAARG
jgi:hypothetical protein